MKQRNPIQKEIISSIISTKRFITDLLRDRMYMKDFTSKLIPYLYEIDDYSNQMDSIVLQRTDVHKTFKTILQLPDTYFTVKEVCSDILNNIMLALKNELFNNIDFFYNLTSNIDSLEFDFDKNKFIEEINNMILTNDKILEQDESMIRTDAKYLEELKKLENNLLLEAKRRQKAKQMEMDKISIKDDNENHIEFIKNCVCVKEVHNKQEQVSHGDNYKGWNDDCKNTKGELLLQQKRNKNNNIINQNEGKTVLLYLKSSHNNINSYKKIKDNKQFSTISSNKNKKNSNNNKSNIKTLKLKQVFTPIKLNIKTQNNSNTIDVKEDIITEETSKKFENERLLRSKTKQINTKNLKNEIFVLETSIRKKISKHIPPIKINIHNPPVKEAKFIINKITSPLSKQKTPSIKLEHTFPTTSLENETLLAHTIPII